jgi:hypothetical protein
MKFLHNEDENLVFILTEEQVAAHENATEMFQKHISVKDVIMTPNCDEFSIWNTVEEMLQDGDETLKDLILETQAQGLEFEHNFNISFETID